MNSNTQLDSTLQTEAGSDSLVTEVIMANKTIDMNSVKRSLLLRTSNTWFEQGSLRQAVEGYLNIIEQYPNSVESNTAQAKLLALAQRYEQEGALRLSLDVLERLEQVMAIE
jgi:hypothetical protein